MRKLTYLAAAALAAGTLGLSAQASATTYTFGFDEPRDGGSAAAGSYEALRFTFDDGTSGADGIAANPVLDVSGSVRLDTEFGTIDGGWFALTPGGDPRATADQIAIFYMDFVSGRLSAYRYDGTLGVNGIDTYQNDDLFIGSFENAVTTTTTDGVLSFSIDAMDVSLIQAASDAEGYTGVGFGEEIGIWLHLAIMRDIAFGEDGRLTAFRTGALASFDLPRADADVVPLPGAALFALTGVAGLAGLRRLRR